MKELGEALRAGLIEDLFSKIDIHGKGKIGKDDLVNALRYGLVQKVPVQKVPKKLDLFCSCGNQFVEDTIFCRKCGANKDVVLKLEKVRKLFDATDADKSG